MNALTLLSSNQLRKAADIQDKITSLQKELGSLLGGSSTSEASAPARNGHRGRRMSAAGRAAISAAAKARWAALKGKAAKPAGKGRRKMSDAAKAKLAAAARLRWKKAKAAGRTTL